MKNTMRANRMKIVVVVLLMILTGCSSSYKDFKVSDVDENEGIAIGKINVVYNGKPHNKECKICISSTCHKLTEEGFVFMPLEQGPVVIETLLCKDGMTEQNQSFQGAQFEVRQGVTYFGNLTFNWINEYPHTFINMVGVGMIGGAALQSSVNARLDGEISMKVEDDMLPVLSAFQQQVGNTEAQAEKSIVSVGVQAEK